jgi:hypothetical protein
MIFQSAELTFNQLWQEIVGVVKRRSICFVRATLFFPMAAFWWWEAIMPMATA